MGFHEYLYDDASVIFIEWPSIIMPLLNGNVCHIGIDYTTELDQRIMTVKID